MRMKTCNSRTREEEDVCDDDESHQRVSEREEGREIRKQSARIKLEMITLR